MTKAGDVVGPLNVGESYIVPCIHLRFGDDKVFVVPVVDHPHEDPELGNPNTHVHYDYRFIDQQMINDIIARVGRNTIPVAHVTGRWSYSYHPIACVHSVNRTDPCDVIGGKVSIDGLNEYCKDRKFLGKVCPHKGYSLEGITPDQEGNLTCPLHGARWRKDGSYVFPAHPLAVLINLFLGSGIPLVGAQMRLFQNDVEPRHGITLDDIEESINYQPVAIPDIGIKTKPLSITTALKVVEFDITGESLVRGYYVTVPSWGLPLWIDRFKVEGCQHHDYKLRKSILHVTLNLDKT